MSRLTARVLGSAAGGGFPQWNCACANCRLAWAGDQRVKRRTQASLAVSVDPECWALINASPDLGAQIASAPALHPCGVSGAVRGSPIAAVVLTGAEIDQIAGLLTLRERQPFALYASAATLAALEANAVFEVLRRDLVPRCAVEPGERFPLPGGLEAELVPVPGKVPLFMEGEAEQERRAPLPDARESTVAVELSSGDRRLLFAPGVASLTEALEARLARADVVLFDGTLFDDDEMIRSGTGEKTGRRMGHIPMAGPDGSRARLAALRNRRIYIHLNNTNPVLVADSPERRAVEAAGWEIAEDGMEIVL